jgi:hypothetical protein
MESNLISDLGGSIAILQFNSKIQINNCKFEQGYGLNSKGSGAIFVLSNNDNIEINGCSFVSNWGV